MGMCPTQTGAARHVVREAKHAVALILFAVLVLLPGCGNRQVPVGYADTDNWAYFLAGVPGKTADVFFICPTVYPGAGDSFNMELSDEETKESFLGATNMEKGIYDADSRFFAPYYRQAGLNAYSADAAGREKYLEIAYRDVQEAFEYYLQNLNNGRPIILAGFSQGADLCLRLLKDYFADEELNARLVACYAIGWSVSAEELEEYPHLKFANGESDTGVIVSFNSEAEEIEDSLMIPKGGKTLAINPLNWRTDGTVADKSLNLGACFTDYGGGIVTEIPHLTGACIDEIRGALKVTDVSPLEYPPLLDIFEDVVYHLYDYQFFYRNLQENVRTRLNSYIAK